MRVLIALDATPRCIEIARAAAIRPWPPGMVFLLVHILDPFLFVKVPIALERAKQAAASQLRDAAEELRKSGWKTETDVILGHPRQAISKIAGSWKADLTMVGSNEPGPLARLFLGSTARSVLRHAPCSVEILRPSPNKEAPHDSRGMRILVATDGSEYSAAALRSVARRPWPKASKVKVISIPEPFMRTGQFPYFELSEIDKLNASALKNAKRYAAAGAEVLSKAGLESTAETPLPEDGPARDIVKEAEHWHAQMVVLGSHGRRGFDRMTMGSVSEHVALHAPCSVEVIRTPLAPNKKPKKKGGRR